MKLLKFITKADRFGDMVNFKIDGDSNFKTLHGGLCTILLGLIVAAYSGNLFAGMVTYSNTLYTRYTELDHFSQFDVNTGQFNIAFNVFDEFSNLPIPNITKFG